MIHFEQFELDDLAAALEPLMRDSVEEMLDADDKIVGYEVRRPDSGPLWEFLERVVEVADRNRARMTKRVKLDLDKNSVWADNPVR